MGTTPTPRKNSPDTRSAWTSSGSPLTMTVTRPSGLYAKTVSKMAVWRVSASKTGYEKDVLTRPPVVVRCQFPDDEFIRARGPDAHENSWSRSGSRTDVGFHSAASMRLKMALLAPMPSASDRMATAVKTGECRSCRTAYRLSATSSSNMRSPSASRHSSFRDSRPPNSARARRRASSGWMPARTRSAV